MYSACPLCDTQNGVTPLMIACNQGQEGAVRLLLQNGADPNILDQVRHAVIQCKFMPPRLSTVLHLNPCTGGKNVFAFH